jgi:thiaminase
MGAREFVERLSRDLEPLEKKILEHPYLEALAQGRVSREALKVFAGQQHHIVSSDLRSMALALHRHSSPEAQRFLLSLLPGEAQALSALEHFAAAVGLSAREWMEVEPVPGGHAYCCFVAWLCLYGSAAELATAFLVNLRAWGSNCRRMAGALMERYGLTEEQTQFFRLFAEAPPLEPLALPVIEQGLVSGVSERQMARAARLLQAYELLYWNAMAEVAGL